MIEALWQLGKMHLKYDLKRDESTLGWEDFVEEPFDIKANPEREYRVIFIDLKKDNNQWIFDKVTKEDYKPEDKMKYLYRKGASNGADLSCSSILVEPEKTFRKKILKWFAGAVKLNKASEVLGSTEKLLNQKSGEIIEKISSVQVKKENQLLTVRWDDGERQFYPGDMADVTDVFRNSSLEKFRYKYSCQSDSREIPCCTCGKTGETMGFGFPFSFYTVDNPGFVTGGFTPKRSVNNLPLCLNCILLLEKGVEALKAFHIRYAFGVSDCFIIPKLINAGKNESSDWKRMAQLRGLFTSNGKSMADNLNTAEKTENRLLRYFENEGNWLTLGFLFFREKKANFEILMYAEDVLPSRLTKINSLMQSSRELLPETWNSDDSVFRFLKDVLESKETNFLMRDYLEILRSILMGQPVSYDFVLDRSMRKIRSDFSKNGNEYFSVVKTGIIMDFLEKIGILKY